VGARVQVQAIHQANFSKHEQRMLHTPARVGSHCILEDCSLHVFRKLRKRRFIRSEEGRSCRITREGLKAVRAQVDNRWAGCDVQWSGRGRIGDNRWNVPFRSSFFLTQPLAMKGSVAAERPLRFTTLASESRVIQSRVVRQNAQEAAHTG
jgi:hypothetical protein